MAEIQVIKSHHFLFACEVINELNHFYQIPVRLHQAEERFFNNDIRWALCTISYLFRKDYIVIFKRIKRLLDSEKTFIQLCMIFLAKRDELYFFNFLKRISFIHEMTVYCFKKGNNYFLAARNCIAEYQFVKYFHSVGSWPRLYETAALLRKLGEPLTLVILEESTLREPLNFSETVERIVNRLKSQNNEVLLNSEATRYLVRQQEKFNAREKDNKTKSSGSKVKKKKIFIRRSESNLCMSDTASADKVSIEEEKKALAIYFRKLFRSECSDEAGRRRNEHTPGGTQYECSSVSKSPQPFELEKPCTNTESTVSTECDNLATESISSLSKKLVETLHFRPDPIVHERLEEDEGKHGSFLKLSDKSNDDANETSNSKQLEEDLFLSESSSDDENSQQCKNSAVEDDPSLLVKCGLNSSNESITSESPSSRKINFPDNKPNNSELLEEDLFLPGPSSAVGNSQQGNTTNATLKDYSSLLAESGLYSSDESIISESPSSRKKFNSPDDKTSNSELLEHDLIASESSSEDESAQKPFMKKESLESKKGLLAECDSSRKSNSSESQSPTKYASTSDNIEHRLNLIAEGFLNRAMQIRPDIFTPENVTAQQSKLKKDKHDDNNSPMVKKAMHSSRDQTFVQRTREKAGNVLLQSAESLMRLQLQTTLAALAASVSDQVDLDSSREAHNENSQAASGNSTIPDGETETATGNEESADDQSTDVKEGSQQQHKKRKSKRKKSKKKKGKRK